MDLSRGQRAKIQDVVGGTTKFDVSPAIESHGLSLDYSVFGVDATGKLAGDEYMCFYNQPSTPCGGVRFSQSGGYQTFSIDLNSLPPKIDRLVLTASIDGSGTMSQITSGNVHFKVNGSPASRFSFTGTDFTSERALILGEVYRKDGIWRFSATAQGFAGGLDALVKHYGGEVAEAAQSSSPPSSASATIAHQSAALQTAPQQPAQKQSLFSRLTEGLKQSPPESQATSPSPQYSAPKPMPSVSLVKGQKISLEKQAGAPLKKVIMGLGWDVSDDDYDIDLDASCVMFDDSKEMVDAVYFGQLKSDDGSIKHTGDNLTGEGDGDDEQIIVDLSRVPENVKYLVFVVNSYQGDTFDEVDNAFCRIVNQSNNKEIARYNISCQGSYTALIMAKLYREDNGWKMQALGVYCDGQVFDEVIPDMICVL